MEVTNRHIFISTDYEVFSENVSQVEVDHHVNFFRSNRMAFACIVRLSGAIDFNYQNLFVRYYRADSDMPFGHTTLIELTFSGENQKLAFLRYQNIERIQRKEAIRYLVSVKWRPVFGFRYYTLQQNQITFRYH